jgi:hypothetical protein
MTSRSDPGPEAPFDPAYLDSIAPDEEPEAERCTCTVLGPDSFGNYDKVDDPECPVCG